MAKITFRPSKFIWLFIWLFIVNRVKSEFFYLVHLAIRGLEWTKRGIFTVMSVLKVGKGLPAKW